MKVSDGRREIPSPGSARELTDAFRSGLCPPLHFLREEKRSRRVRFAGDSVLPGFPASRGCFRVLEHFDDSVPRSLCHGIVAGLAWI